MKMPHITIFLVWFGAGTKGPKKFKRVMVVHKENLIVIEIWKRIALRMHQIDTFFLKPSNFKLASMFEWKIKWKPN